MVGLCTLNLDMGTGNFTDARRFLAEWTADFPDRFKYGTYIADYYAEMGDFDRASDWYERAYERHEGGFFWNAFVYISAKYRTTDPRWKKLTQEPLFKAWQAEHDRIAAALATHRDPLN